MAKTRRKAPKKNPPAALLPPVLPAGFDEDDLLTQDEVDLFTFLEEIGPSTAVIEVFRMNRDGSRPHLETVTMDVIRENVYQYLRETWGGGKYLLQFKNSLRRIIKNKVIDIEARPGFRPGGAPGVAADPANDPHFQFLREQHAQQQTLLTTLIAGLAQRPVPDFKMPDAAAMLTAVVAAFATLRGDPGKDESLDKVAKIIGIAKDLNQPDKEETWPGIVRDVGKEVVSMFRGAPAQIPAAVDRPAPAALEFRGSPAPMAAAPIAADLPAPTETVVQSFQDYIRLALAYLKQKSQLGKDPEIYIQWIFDNQEEQLCSALKAAVENGATVDHLLQFDAEIAQNPAHVLWFRKLHAGILRELDAERNDRDDDTERPAGDTRNAGSDAAASTT